MSNSLLEIELMEFGKTKYHRGRNRAEVGCVDRVVDSMLRCISSFFDLLGFVLVIAFFDAALDPTGIAQAASNGGKLNRDSVFRIIDLIGEAILIAFCIIADHLDLAGYSTFASKKGADDLVGLYATSLLIIDEFEALNGFGPPDLGGKFRKESAEFSIDIAEILRKASPDECEWSGLSAEFYREKAGQQRNLIEIFAETDREIAHIISIQAGQVKMVREALVDAKTSLIACAGASVLLSICAQTRATFDMLVIVVGGALQLALVTAYGLISGLAAEAVHNAKLIKKAQRGYARVIHAAKVDNESVATTFNVAEVSASVVTSDFSAVEFRSSDSVNRLNGTGVAALLRRVALDSVRNSSNMHFANRAHLWEYQSSVSGLERTTSTKRDHAAADPDQKTGELLEQITWNQDPWAQSLGETPALTVLGHGATTVVAEELLAAAEGVDINSGELDSLAVPIDGIAGVVDGQQC